MIVVEMEWLRAEGSLERVFSDFCCCGKLVVESWVAFVFFVQAKKLLRYYNWSLCCFQLRN